MEIIIFHLFSEVSSHFVIYVIHGDQKTQTVTFPHF